MKLVRFLLFLSILLSGCTYGVVPPENPPQTASVFLLDHGRHSSLVLPQQGKLIRYAYGDWKWYALVQTGVVQGSRALLGPSPAGLGRKHLEGPASLQEIRNQLVVAVERGWSIPVGSEQISHLAQRLNAIFQKNWNSRTYNPKYDLLFVRHPKPYTWSHNSNAVVAGWLEELGCQVDEGGLLSRWEVLGQVPGSSEF